MRLSIRDRTAETACSALPSLPHILTHHLGTYTRYSGLHSASTVNFFTPLTIASECILGAGKLSACTASLFYTNRAWQRERWALHWGGGSRPLYVVHCVPSFLLSAARQSSTCVDKFPQMRERDRTVGSGTQGDYDYETQQRPRSYYYNFLPTITLNTSTHFHVTMDTGILQNTQLHAYNGHRGSEDNAVCPIIGLLSVTLATVPAFRQATWT